MKCTSCGRPVTPVVAVDIDGTLGNYHWHFLEFARRWLPAAEMMTQDFEKNCGLDRHTWRAVKLAYRQGGMKRTMPVFHGASLLTQEISKAGAEIWVTTTRPAYRLDNIDPDTQEWLRRNSVEYDYVLYDPDKYEELHQMVGPNRVVAVLEDLPDQAERAVRLFGRGAVILRNNAYSNHASSNGMARVNNLEEAKIEILQKIGEWNATHS